MRKMFTIIAITCMTFLSGFFLFACDLSSSYKIELSFDSSDYFEVVLEQYDRENGNKILDAGSDGKFQVDKSSDVKVKINAKEHGIDLSEINVSVNNVQKKLQINSNFSNAPGGDLYYGYFLLPKISSDIKIEIAGAKYLVTTFTFEIPEQDLQDQEIIEKLKMTYINTDQENEEENFKNFYEFLTEGSKSYQREFDSSSAMVDYNTFKLKFDAVNPFDISSNLPFKISSGSGEEDISEMNFNSDGYFVVNLGQLGNASSYKISVDFSALKFEVYSINFPSDNMAFKVEKNAQTISYLDETDLGISKELESSFADYSAMKVFINNLELEKIAGSETSKSVKYLIPKNLTPLSTGGTNRYDIKVTGIKYLVDTYAMTCTVNDGTAYLVRPELITFDSNYNPVLPGIGDNGESISLAGQLNSLMWSYTPNGIDTYSSIYDLYDYNIYIDYLEETQEINLKELLGQSTTDVSADLENGLSFSATYNSKTKKFDQFAISFMCNADIDFRFDDFVEFEKSINLSYGFDDERVESVDFAISNYNGGTQTWTELQRNQSLLINVKGRQIVMFRIGSKTSQIGGHEFRIENSIVSNSWLEAESYTDNGTNYTILKFVLSDTQYYETMDCKLIPAGSM